MTDRYGTDFERDVMEYLRLHGHDTERLRLTGEEDEGDLVLRIKGYSATLFLLQLKANRSANTSASLGARLRDVETQAEAYQRHRGLEDRPLPVVVIKNPRKPIKSSFVVMRLDDFIGAEDG